jgi:hypothetical protein
VAAAGPVYVFNSLSHPADAGFHILSGTSAMSRPCLPLDSFPNAFRKQQQAGSLTAIFTPDSYFDEATWAAAKLSYARSA